MGLCSKTNIGAGEARSLREPLAEQNSGDRCRGTKHYLRLTAKWCGISTVLIFGASVLLSVGLLALQKDKFYFLLDEIYKLISDHSGLEYSESFKNHSQALAKVDKSRTNIQLGIEISVLIAAVLMVGAGFLWGRMKFREKDKKNKELRIKLEKMKPKDVSKAEICAFLHQQPIERAHNSVTMFHQILVKNQVNADLYLKDCFSKVPLLLFSPFIELEELIALFSRVTLKDANALLKYLYQNKNGTQVGGQEMCLFVVCFAYLLSQTGFQEKVGDDSAILEAETFKESLRYLTGNNIGAIDVGSLWAGVGKGLGAFNVEEIKRVESAATASPQGGF